MRQLDQTPCRSCGALIAFVRNVTPDARSKWLVVNPDPVPDGNIAVNVYRRTGNVLPQAVRPGAGPLHEPHHRTCPAAAQHRSRKPANPALFTEEEE